MAQTVRFKFAPSAPVTTNAVTTVSVGTFAFNAVPGYGDTSALTQYEGVVKSRVGVLSSGGDHGSKVWVLQTTFKLNAGSGFSNGAVVSDTDATGGVLDNQGTDSNGTFAYDSSGGSFRFRVTPSNTNNMIWFAEHDCTFWIP